MIVSALLACGPDTPETSPPPGPTDSGSPPTTDSGPVEDGIRATCAATDNALRFLCRVTVDPPQPVRIAFHKEAGGPERVHVSPEVAREHDVWLYFLAPHTDYAYTASGDGDGAPTTSGALTTGVPEDDVNVRLQTTGASSMTYVGTNLPCGSGATGGIFDAATGELLWYEVADAGGTFGGYEMLQFTEAHTLLGQSGHVVSEIDLTGADLLRAEAGVDYVENLHHDLFERDGLLYLLYNENGAVLLDGFLIWDRDGHELGRWFSADHLEIPSGASGDWMHTNTIWVDADRYVYLSSFNQNSLLKVDGDLDRPTFGEVQWVLAGSPPNGLGQDFTVDWTRVGDEDGFAHQHALNQLADGRFALLDNGHGRGLVLDVDEATRTAVVDEAYPTGLVACGPQGTTTQTAAGNYLVACASLGIQEFAPGGLVPVWSGELQCANGGGGGSPSNTATRWYPLEGW